jgi:hypothetical protein
MKKFHVLTALLFPIIFYSCKKDEKWKCASGIKDYTFNLPLSADELNIIPITKTEFDTLTYLRNGKDTIIFTLQKIDTTYYPRYFSDDWQILVEDSCASILRNFQSLKFKYRSLQSLDSFVVVHGMDGYYYSSYGLGVPIDRITYVLFNHTHFSNPNMVIMPWDNLNDYFPEGTGDYVQLGRTYKKCWKGKAYQSSYVNSIYNKDYLLIRFEDVIKNNVYELIHP